jgi:hypothetical protein
MKKVFLLFFITSAVNAQTIECPKSSQGKSLSGYSVFSDKQTELQGGFRKVKGGYEVDMPNKFDYFVCEYGEVKNWQELKIDNEKLTCVVKVKEVKSKVSEIKLVCK